ncbi:hypothetical protein [Paraburkholderia phenazinium]|uniref:hypothetical protein n=1 Tax=Paraburkholderia phenazinium TaxID=60549 RepID=UPI00115FCA50|nr:hypothetical protein [Paraburkholderia phenazinium]
MKRKKCRIEACRHGLNYAEGIVLISPIVRNCGTTVKVYSNEFKQSGVVPLKQQIANEKQRYRFAALVQIGDRGR